jgi:hypothetical protein
MIMSPAIINIRPGFTHAGGHGLSYCGPTVPRDQGVYAALCGMKVSQVERKLLERSRHETLIIMAVPFSVVVPLEYATCLPTYFEIELACHPDGDAVVT